MDQHQVEAAVSDAVAQVGDSVDELVGKTGKTMQEKIDQAKPALRDLQESAGAALDKAGVSYEVYVYEGANHAFHNDTAPTRYNEAAAKLAWQRTLKFFSDYLK